jgi:hypothetical protein
MLRSILLASFLVAACTTAPDDSTVAAIRCRELIVEGPIDYVHGGGRWHDVLYLPDAGVHAQVVWTPPEILNDRHESPVMHAWFGPPDEQPRDPVRVQIPAALADRIVALARMTRERDQLGSLLARAAVDAGALRGPESVKPRDEEPEQRGT